MKILVIGCGSIGKKKSLSDRLRREFSIGDIEAGLRRIKSLDEQITRRNTQIQKNFNQLRENYSF